MSATMAVVFDLLEHDSLKRILHPITTLSIVLYACACGDRGNRKYFYLMVTGLFCCFIGDLTPLKEDMFVWELTAFLVARVLFIEAFRSFKGVPLSRLNIAIITLAGIIVFSFLYSGLKDFIVPILVFIIAVIIMTASGIALHRSGLHKNSKNLPSGVLLLLLCDVLTGFDKFSDSPSWLSALIMVTYYSGSVLLSTSILSSSIKEESIISEPFNTSLEGAR